MNIKKEIEKKHAKSYSTLVLSLTVYDKTIIANIGDSQAYTYNEKENEVQKIILSSDGITDLISEERFKSYFKSDIESEKIVKDALSKEDTKWLDKDEGNISVIVIKLSNYTQKKLVK